ncbi:hypothetical protein AWB68_06322 [Caballeronia choica]|jgi:hypothetical protein|uniref:Uncharacterized protein n=1 Tax=Caballeronia choica TaxID=326476 RepID=A0A158KNF2_9BURK|nr:hypothetical protein AWB68_06322 [Caballeronia choica]
MLRSHSVSRFAHTFVLSSVRIADAGTTVHPWYTSAADQRADHQWHDCREGVRPRCRNGITTPNVHDPFIGTWLPAGVCYMGST